MDQGIFVSDQETPWSPFVANSRDSGRDDSSDVTGERVLAGIFIHAESIINLLFRREKTLCWCNFWTLFPGASQCPI